MRQILGGQVFTPGNGSHVFGNGNPRLAQAFSSPGPIGEYFDVPNGAFPVPWGSDDCHDPHGCDTSLQGEPQKLGTPSRFDGVSPAEYARRQGLGNGQTLSPGIQIRPVALAGQAPYRMPAWRPAPMALVERPKMGQSTAGVAAIGAIPMLLGAAWGAGAAWVGFSTGAREKGLLSILGYVVGSVGALGAIFGTLGAILWVSGVAVFGEEIQRDLQPSPSPVPGPVPPTTPSFSEFEQTPGFPGEFPEFPSGF